MMFLLTGEGMGIPGMEYRGQSPIMDELSETKRVTVPNGTAVVCVGTDRPPKR
jgi:hypothetical protein